MTSSHRPNQAAPSTRPDEVHERSGTSHNTARRPRRHHLSRWMRVLLFGVGWVLVVVGVAGLVLPGIQGIITILAGLAVLSVVSRRAHGWVRRVLSRWPRLRKRVERLRWRVRRRFGRAREGPAAASEPPEPAQPKKPVGEDS